MTEEVKEQKEEVQEKMVHEAEIVSGYVPFGVVSFEELDGVKQSQAAGQMARELSNQFQEMVSHIFNREDVTDKPAAIKSLADEFAQRVDDAMEQKEVEEKAVWSTKFVNDLPDSSFFHVLPGGKKDGEGKTVPRSNRMFPYKDKGGKVDLPHLRNAIARIPQSNRIDAATKSRLQTKARNILKKQQKEIDDASLMDRTVKALKSIFGVKEKTEPKPFSLWKEADGTMRWFAVYSNNYRDDDKPPEIISKAAHLDFVRAVDEKEWPMPELRHWHVKGSRYGMADLIAYDEDTGMSIAAGTIDKGMEEIAKAIFERGPLVSHGMPTPEIERDGTDKTILTRYRTKEISTLPNEAAANKITFYDLKEQNMNIPEQKLEELEAVGFDIEALTAKLEGGKEQAESEERESKETKEEVVENVAETDAPQETAEVPETAPDVNVAPALTADDIATAFTAAVSPIIERVEAIEGRIKELAEPNDTEEKELDLTPAASLKSAMISAVIGKPEAQVDGRKARHDGPTETKGQNPGAALNSGQELMDDIVNTITSNDRSWLLDLPGVNVQ
jgi:hypothetical protein